MKNVNLIKKIITALIVTCFLSYFLFATKDFMSRIIISIFLIYSFFFLLSKVFLILNKKKLAQKFSKIYVIAFLIYYFGFLIYWDYISLINKEYVSFIISLLCWFGGCFVAYRRFKKK